MSGKPTRRTCPACEYPSDVICDSPDETAYGESVQCDECGTAYILGKDMREYRTIHIVMERENIAHKKDDRRGAVWQITKTSNGKKLHLTCPSCLKIHEEVFQRVDVDGFLGGRVANSCISCECGLHFWPYLKGWKGRKKT